MNSASLDYIRMMGTPQQPMSLEGTDLSSAKSMGGAFRFVNMKKALVDPRTDFRNTFGDATVLLPSGIERPCQWRAEALSDAIFFAHWRGWIEAGPEKSKWLEVAPEEWRDVEPLPPPPGCTWHD